MKTDHLKESNNIEDRRNEGGSASYGSGNTRLGNGILRILLAPGSFKSKLVLILLLLFLGGGAGLSGILTQGLPTTMSPPKFLSKAILRSMTKTPNLSARS